MIAGPLVGILEGMRPSGEGPEGSNVRGIVRVLLATVVLVGVAACGDDDEGAGAPTSADDRPATTASSTPASDQSTPSTEAAAEEFDPEGVLRIGAELDQSRGGLELDPVNPISSGTHQYLYPIYGSLLQRAADGSWEPDLATDWEVIDAQTVELGLRTGVTFQDGTPFDAEAVRFNLDRARQAPTGAMSTEIRYLDTIEVVDPATVRLHFNQPVSGWLFNAERAFFGSVETLMASPTAATTGDLSTNPVGAGAFRFVRYTPGQEYVVEKNPDYWDADDVRLGGIHLGLHGRGAGAAQRPAHRRRRPDLGRHRRPGAGAGVVPRDPVDAEVTGNRLWSIYLCKSRPPFDDVRVRQALNLAVDREAIIEVMFAGVGEPMTGGTWPSGSPFYVSALEGHYDRDVDEAKAPPGRGGGHRRDVRADGGGGQRRDGPD